MSAEQSAAPMWRKANRREGRYKYWGFMFFRLLAVLCFSSIFTNLLLASPWIGVGEDRLRHHLELLNDSGVISVQTASWPLMWADVKRQLAAVSRYDLEPSQKIAVRELEFELRYQTRQGLKQSIGASMASSRALFSNFASSPHEKGEFSKQFDWDGRNIAARLQTNLTTRPGADSAEFEFEGSYVAGTIGDWVVGAGAIDRWWGPSQQTSLILSSNARPVPGIMLRTKIEQEFESPWLNWIGTWHFTSFVGQMESDRHISGAKLTGMRLTIKPTANLEIGFSRAMQWGGEGRSESLQTFLNAITSKGENSAEQSGNQLGGIDVRYSLNGVVTLPSAVYMQTIGEDEAGYMPSRRTYLFGVESSLGFKSGAVLNAYLEYINTVADPFNDEFFNMSYEHSVYKAGYRYRDRVLGASFDNDAEVVSFGGSYLGVNGDLFSLTLNYAKLNQDGAQSGNTVSSSAVDIVHSDASYQAVIGDSRFKIGVAFYSDFVPTMQLDIDETSIYGKWEYRF